MLPRDRDVILTTYFPNWCVSVHGGRREMRREDEYGKTLTRGESRYSFNIFKCF